MKLLLRGLSNYLIVFAEKKNLHDFKTRRSIAEYKNPAIIRYSGRT